MLDFWDRPRVRTRLITVERTVVDDRNVHAMYVTRALRTYRARYGRRKNAYLTWQTVQVL